MTILMIILKTTNDNLRNEVVAGAKHGKTCNQCQAREKNAVGTTRGKNVANGKRGITYNQCQERENM